MEFYAVKDKRTKGYFPAGANDQEKSNKIPDEDMVKISHYAKRSYLFHKKFFALIRLSLNNLPEQYDYKNEDDLREALLIEAGYFDLIKKLDGDVVVKPKSVSYESMDNHMFEQMYSDVFDVILQRFDFDKEFVERELINFF